MIYVVCEVCYLKELCICLILRINIWLCWGNHWLVCLLGFGTLVLVGDSWSIYSPRAPGWLLIVYWLYIGCCIPWLSFHDWNVYIFMSKRIEIKLYYCLLNLGYLHFNFRVICCEVKFFLWYVPRTLTFTFKFLVAGSNLISYCGESPYLSGSYSFFFTRIFVLLLNFSVHQFRFVNFFCVFPYFSWILMNWISLFCFVFYIFIFVSFLVI